MPRQNEVIYRHYTFFVEACISGISMFLEKGDKPCKMNNFH